MRTIGSEASADVISAHLHVLGMNALERAVELVRGLGGVVDAYVMDDDLSRRILEEERSVVSMTKMDVINNAYEDVMKRSHRIAVIFENDTFDYVRDSASIIMVNSKGETVGKSLDPDEIEEYQKDESNVWVSSNFVLFDVDRIDGSERFVVPPASFPLLNEEKEYSDAIFASPATTSDMMLKMERGADLRKKTSTIVIGFNTND